MLSQLERDRLAVLFDILRDAEMHIARHAAQVCTAADRTRLLKALNHLSRVTYDAGVALSSLREAEPHLGVLPDDPDRLRRRHARLGIALERVGDFRRATREFRVGLIEAGRYGADPRHQPPACQRAADLRRSLHDLLRDTLDSDQIPSWTARRMTAHLAELEHLFFAVASDTEGRADIAAEAMRDHVSKNRGALCARLGLRTLRVDEPFDDEVFLEDPVFLETGETAPEDTGDALDDDLDDPIVRSRKLSGKPQSWPTVVAYSSPQ